VAGGAGGRQFRARTNLDVSADRLHDPNTHRAVDTGDPLVVNLAVEALLDPLRENPAFKQIMRRLHFPPVERRRNDPA
jgi:hypothetical protein